MSDPQDLAARKESLEESRTPLQEGFVESEIENNKTSDWDNVKSRIRSDQQRMDAGFYRVDMSQLQAADLTRSMPETAQAVFKTGMVGSYFYGARPDLSNQMPDFEVSDYIPEDRIRRYPDLFAAVGNPEAAYELDKTLQGLESYNSAMRARPLATFGWNFLQPDQLALDIASYGAAAMVMAPIIGNSVNQMRRLPVVGRFARTNPATRAFLTESFAGASSAAISVAASNGIKMGFNDAYEIDDFATELLYASIIGTALGGGVGYVRGKKIANSWKTGFEVGQLAPPPAKSMELVGPPEKGQGQFFIGPPEPEVRTPPPRRAELGLKMQLAEDETVPQVGEQRKINIGQDVDEIAIMSTDTESGVAARASAYEGLRGRFSIIGESIINNEKTPPLLRKAVSVVTFPLRKMSAANRLLSERFGSGRLFTMSMVRNGIEFVSTRSGVALPRSAQNIIDDFSSVAANYQISLHKAWLDANNIKQGAFATEKANFGKVAISKVEFNEAVSQHMLILDRPEEALSNVNPHIKAAAREAWDTIYRPIGDRLKQLNILDPDASVSDVVNYLNREWSTRKIFQDPDGFIDWLSDRIEESNAALRSMLPNYENAIEYADGARQMGQRFLRAAREIKELEAVAANKEAAVKKAEAQEKASIDKVHEHYKERIDKIKARYEKLRSKESPKVPDISTTKKLLRQEIKEARKERDFLIDEISKETEAVKLDIKDIRTKRDADVKSYRSGKKDREILQEYREVTEERLIDKGFDPQEKEIQGLLDEAVDEVQANNMKLLRNQAISRARASAASEIDLKRADLSALKKNKSELLSENRKSLDKTVTEAMDLLAEESQLKGKLTQKDRAQRALDSREEVEIKLAKTQEKLAVFRKKTQAKLKLRKLKKPIERLEYLKKRFSREGFLVQTKLKQAQQAIERAPDALFPPERKKEMLKALKRQEREAIRDAAPDNEAFEIGKEMMEYYDQQMARAEEMIPQRFRSNKTGLPHETWDPSVDTASAKNIATKSYEAIIGQDSEFVTNPVMEALSGGRARIFKPRALNVEDNAPGISQWREFDMGILVNNFVSGASPAIALTEVMQELNKLPIVRATVKRMQIGNKAIGPDKARNLPDTMQNYQEIPKVLATMMRDEYRALAEGLSGKELQKLNDAYKRAEGELSTIDLETKGMFRNGMNVNASNASDIVDMINSYTTTTVNNNLGISNLADLVNGMLPFGVGNWIKKGLLPVFESPEFKALNKKEAQAMGIANKIAMGTITMARISGRENSLKNGVWGKGITNFANRLGNITGANAIQDAAEMINFSLVKGSLLEMAEKAYKGTISQKEIAHLAQGSLTVDQAKNIYTMWKKYGFEKGSLKGIDPDKVPNFNPGAVAAYRDYAAWVKDTLRKLSPRPGVGSLPNLAYTPHGKSILFLKKWYFAATNDLFFPAMQRADKEAAQGFMFLLAMGALQSELRKTYRDADKREEFNLEGYAFEALSNSAMLGIYTWPIDLATAAGFVAGNGGAKYDPMNGMASWLGGPGVIGMTDRAFNILGRLRRIATDDDRDFTSKDLNYIAGTGLPLYRWAPIASLAKPKIREYFDEG